MRHSGTGWCSMHKPSCSTIISATFQNFDRYQEAVSTEAAHTAVVLHCPTKRPQSCHCCFRVRMPGTAMGPMGGATRMTGPPPLQPRGGCRGLDSRAHGPCGRLCGRGMDFLRILGPFPRIGPAPTRRAVDQTVIPASGRQAGRFFHRSACPRLHGRQMPP